MTAQLPNLSRVRRWALQRTTFIAALSSLLLTGCAANKVLLQSFPAGAKVYQHGQVVGTTPMTLEAGTSDKVEVRMKGYHPVPVAIPNPIPAKLRIALRPVAKPHTGSSTLLGRWNGEVKHLVSETGFHYKIWIEIGSLQPGRCGNWVTDPKCGGHLECVGESDGRTLRIRYFSNSDANCKTDDSERPTLVLIGNGSVAYQEGEKSSPPNWAVLRRVENEPPSFARSLYRNGKVHVGFELTSGQADGVCHTRGKKQNEHVSLSLAFEDGSQTDIQMQCTREENGWYTLSGKVDGTSITTNTENGAILGVIKTSDDRTLASFDMTLTLTHAGFERKEEEKRAAEQLKERNEKETKRRKKIAKSKLSTWAKKNVTLQFNFSQTTPRTRCYNRVNVQVSCTSAAAVSKETTAAASWTAKVTNRGPFDVACKADFAAMPGAIDLTFGRFTRRGTVGAKSTNTFSHSWSGRVRSGYKRRTIIDCKVAQSDLVKIIPEAPPGHTGTVSLDTECKGRQQVCYSVWINKAKP